MSRQAASPLAADKPTLGRLRESLLCGRMSLCGRILGVRASRLVRLSFDSLYISVSRGAVEGAQRNVMSKNLYIGNLPFSATDESLRAVFEQFGTVSSVKVISDRMTGRSRGFGFIEMDEGGDAAIEAMNGKELEGRVLTVNEARPRADRPRGNGGGDGGRY